MTPQMIATFVLNIRGDLECCCYNLSSIMSSTLCTDVPRLLLRISRGYLQYLLRLAVLGL
jgi:hypothetical protein